MSKEATRTTCYIALGANIGDRSKNLRDALNKLDATDGIRVSAVSSFLENPAVGGPAGSPPFVNAVAQIETSLDPRALLDSLLQIEQSMGRRRLEKWGPRTIDLDLLLYGNRIIAEEHLIVPHPRMKERLFVLAPLAELAPMLIVPGQSMTIRELLREAHGH